MSRGGRGGRGGRRTGPDLSWEDEPIIADNKKPEPLFPELNPPLSTPKPLSDDEIERVNDYLAFRETIRNGPLYAVLKTNSFTDEKGQRNKRAGFDPFTGMEKYSARFEKPLRTMPDLSKKTYHLPFYPRELWPALDPAWRKRKSVADPTTSSAAKKHKRTLAELIPEDEDPEDEDEDAPIASTKRRKRAPKKTSDEQEKSGLEAEDDIPDVDPAGGDDDDGLGSELSDAVFSDDEGGDYAAEGYFDDGMGDDGYGDDGDAGGGEGTFD